MQVEGFHQLVRRAQDGDAPALERLLAQTRPLVAQLAEQFSDPSDPARSASDLVQEAELQVWRRLTQFDGAANDEETLKMFQAWLAQLVRRLGMDAHRRRNARRRRQPGRAVLPLSSGGSSGAAGESGAARKEPPGKEPTPSAQLSADERAQRVVAAVRAIEDASERSIVELYFFEELTLHQIAERLGMPYWKTKETYRRAIRRLEAALGASL